MSLLSKTSLSLVWTVPSTLCLCSRGRGAGRRGASCFNAESVPSLGQLGRQRRTQLLCSKSQRCYALMAHLGLQHSIRNCAKGVGASDHKRLSCDHNAVTLLEAFSGHLLRLPKLPAEHKSQPTDPEVFTAENFSKKFNTNRCFQHHSHNPIPALQWPFFVGASWDAPHPRLPRLWLGFEKLLASIQSLA